MPNCKTIVIWDCLHAIKWYITK